MIRFCPRCRSERALKEFFCEGRIEGAPCHWDLSAEPIRPEGWRPKSLGLSGPAGSGQNPVCPNGHQVESGDLICLICGVDLAPASPPAGFEPAVEEGSIDGWQVLEPLKASGRSCRRFRVRHQENGREGALELYLTGFEPETRVFSALKNVSLEHVPELYDFGRWDGRAYSVMELLTGQTLADLGPVIESGEGLRRTVRELGEALHALTEAGIRHRDLKPGALLVRTRDPLDLVIAGFGSARLSDFDLDIVAPLETNIYTAPEALVGVISPASDWWSLGMILLEQLSGGSFLKGVNSRALMIRILTEGLEPPGEIDPEAKVLLAGLLIRDHQRRWQWPEVRDWLKGEYLYPAAALSSVSTGRDRGHGIAMGGRIYPGPRELALAAAQEAHWPEALDLFQSGALPAWLDGLDLRAAGRMRLLAEAAEEVAPDLALMLALKILNPDLPLIYQGEIVTPGWLLARPLVGYELITSSLPQLLNRLEISGHDWLERLQERALRVRQSARDFEVELDEEALRLYLLNTSQARLAAIWAERLKIFPEALNPRLSFLSECSRLSDLDLIILLSAELHQFRPAEEVLDEAEALSRQANLPPLDREAAAGLLELPRDQLYQRLGRRLENFAYCDSKEADQWAQDYRLAGRLPLVKILALLGSPEDIWQEPPRQRYLSKLLGFYEKKILSSARRGSLVRMNTGLNSANIDLMDLDGPRLPAAEILNHLIGRHIGPLRLDPILFDRPAQVESGRGRSLLTRLARLLRKDERHQRDSGLMGLYLGFPFVVLRSPVKTQKPRLMPLLLWPLKISERGFGQVDLAFDGQREGVRLNQALEQFLSPEALENWQRLGADLLSRSDLNLEGAMEILGPGAAFQDPQLQKLDSLNRQAPGEGELLLCSAVLFHSSFMGQGVGRELRELTALPPSPTAMSRLLGLMEPETEEPIRSTSPLYAPSTGDPSQQQAVRRALNGQGLLIEGPPGTGKSQTIVNITAEALGRGGNLLIVCQKRAALEVVRKRLEAEGLGRRLIMVGDVVKDRRPLIRDIREQVSLLFKDLEPEDLEGLAEERRLAAEEFKSLEDSLDRAHELYFQVDRQTGFSYREILGRLIGLGDQSSVPAPQLRQILRGQTPDEISGLADRCAPLVPLWLAADFEDNPLGGFKPFQADEAALKEIDELLQALWLAENRRLDFLRKYETPVAIDDAEPYRPELKTWFKTYAPKIEDLSPDEWELLQAWLPLFKIPGEKKTADRGPEILADLDAAGENLAYVDKSLYSHNYSRVLAQMDDGPLAGLKTAAGLRPESTSIWGKALPGYWLGRKRLKKFFSAYDGGRKDREDNLKELRGALSLEERWRPFRRQLQYAERELRLESPGYEDGRLLAPAADQLRRLLRRLGGLIESLARLPQSEGLDRAILHGDRARWAKALEEYRVAFERWRNRSVSLALLKRLSAWLEDEVLDELAKRVEDKRDSVDLIRPLLERQPQLKDYQSFRSRTENLSELDLNFFSLLRLSEKELALLPPEKLESAVRLMVEQEACQGWKERLEVEHPELAQGPAQLETRKRRLKISRQKLGALNTAILKTPERSQIRPPAYWEDISRLTGKRALSLRRFIEEALPLGLMKLRPVWLMNPDSASRILPLAPALFDTVVYDEASQLPVEYALPTLYRGSSAVISGDAKQMPPSSFFTARLEDSLEEESPSSEHDRELLEILEEDRREQREVRDCTDILHLGRRVLPPQMLEIHYRSRYRELIEFSNAAFYGGRLNIPVRHSRNELIGDKPLRFIEAGGTYQDQTNQREAETVLELLRKIWRAPASGRPSVGVVTFNQKQADLIDELIEAEIEADSTFRRAFQEENARLAHGEDASFFVKNVENVQGDERDFIIFSSTFGRDPAGRFLRNFGILGHQGGERRLNVAITRARYKVILVSSMPLSLISDMLNTDRKPQAPRDYLQLYWAYAQALSGGCPELAGQYLARLGWDEAPRSADFEADEFLAAVKNQVESLGWKVSPGLADDAFNLDFLVECPDSGRYFLGLECDAPRHRLLSSAEARELWRPEIIKRTGVEIHRLSSRDWQLDPGREKEKLRRVISEAHAAQEATV